MTDFQKIDNESDERMYGPRAALVCGVEEGQRRAVLEVLGVVRGLRVVFATEKHRERNIGKLLAGEADDGPEKAGRMPRLMLLSGLTQAEFHRVMSEYRRAGLPRPLWASLTPFSEEWTLGQLLDELEEERRQFEQRSGS